MVREEVRTIDRDLHMDGVFADTVMVTRDVFTAARERRMEKGIRSLERALKSWSGGGLVVLNNGDADAASLRGVDGVMIETDVKEFPSDWDDVRLAVARLDPLRRSRGLLVTALIYVPTSADPAQACRGLATLNLPAAIYRANAAGQALTGLPIATCP